MSGELVQVQTNNAIMLTGQAAVDAVKMRVITVQMIYKEIMREGKDGADGDYGTIPGCGTKKALKKSGAEKLLLGFQVTPTIKVDKQEHPNGHREYSVVCTLSGRDGTVLGEGVGSCSTLEKKYRYRPGDSVPTDKPVPSDYWVNRKTNPKKAQESIGGKGFDVKKVDGKWAVVQRGEIIENQDPADHYNTALKMAKKRALVDAVLTVFGASDIFTQDLDEDDLPQEDHTDGPEPQEPKSKTEEKPEPEKTPIGANGTISQAQIIELSNAAKAAGYTKKEDVIDVIDTEFGYKSRKDIKVEDYPKVLEHFKMLEAMKKQA